MNELKAFLQSELKRRDISMRQFADMVGVSHATISRLVAPDTEEVNVSLEFLLKLSKTTGTPLTLLIKMVDPEVPVETGALSASGYLMAQRIESLPDDIRAIVTDDTASIAHVNKRAGAHHLEQTIALCG